MKTASYFMYSVFASVFLLVFVNVFVVLFSVLSEKPVVQVAEPVAEPAPLLMRMVMLEDVGPFRADVIRDGQPAVATPDGGVMLRKGTVIDVPLDTEVPVVPESGPDGQERRRIRKVSVSCASLGRVLEVLKLAAKTRGEAGR